MSLLCAAEQQIPLGLTKEEHQIKRWALQVVSVSVELDRMVGFTKKLSSTVISQGHDSSGVYPSGTRLEAGGVCVPVNHRAHTHTHTGTLFTHTSGEFRIPTEPNVCVLEAGVQRQSEPTSFITNILLFNHLLFSLIRDDSRTLPNRHNRDNCEMRVINRNSINSAECCPAEAERTFIYGGGA